ncbi:MAG: exodeoxyribonuclease VII small subunit [Sphingomonadales bacterium]|nr:exodeoxyribonuclease VII small subunit [Sphingomonadales bacterium]MDE2169353.1 exodeoxyribonuclease VII small subunit [Sphingomonadales bacterium]
MTQDRVTSPAASAGASDADAARIGQMSFEEALRALEGVVRQLESGEVPLDDSISLYETGEKLRAACQARLDAASARIERIVAAGDGSIAVRPFDEN